MAAHLEGKGVGIIDMAGLAQKGGAVASHIRFSNRPEDIHAIRVAARSADLVLGGDIVVAGSKKVLAAVKPGTTAMIINLAEMLSGEFTRNPEFTLPTERLKRTISSLAGAGNTHFVNASALSTALLGQSLGANMFMLGYAYQLGTLPISAEAIEKAIETERRGGRHESRGVPLGPPRRGRSRERRDAGAAGRRRGRSGAPALGIVRRDGVAPGRSSSPPTRTPPMPSATGDGSRPRRPPRPRRRLASPALPKRSRDICSS